MNLSEMYGKYGKHHKMFVQGMMTRGMVPSRDLKVLFEVVMNRCEIKIPEGKESRGVAEQIFYKAVNDKLKKCGLKLQKCLDEEMKTKVSYMVLVNQNDRSKDSNQLTVKDQVNFLPHELEYLQVLLDRIMEDPLREIRETKGNSV